MQSSAPSSCVYPGTASSRSTLTKQSFVVLPFTARTPISAQSMRTRHTQDCTMKCRSRSLERSIPMKTKCEPRQLTLELSMVGRALRSPRSTSSRGARVIVGLTVGLQGFPLPTPLLASAVKAHLRENISSHLSAVLEGLDQSHMTIGSKHKTKPQTFLINLQPPTLTYTVRSKQRRTRVSNGWDPSSAT